MNNKVHYVLLSAVAVLLVLTICCEAIHLTHHFCVDVVYQQKILGAINAALGRIEPTDQKEDIVKKFKAQWTCYLPKEDLKRTLPRREQGRYSASWHGEVLDWTCYSIEPLCDYVGWMEIGTEGGSVKAVRVVYTSDGE